MNTTDIQSAMEEDQGLCEQENMVPPIVPDTAYYDYHISRMKRKNVPPPDTEDSKAIKRVIEEFDKLDVPTTVQEFVTFIGPYTKDEGNVMRTIMEEDMAKFEKLQNEVYKPLLDDTADVLMNEDLQRAKKYADEETGVNSQILDMVSEIYRMVPNFNFKEFFINPMKYLAEVLPFPAVSNASEDSEIKVQGLYHRYRWMETELARLGNENREMEDKLKELKTTLRKQRQKTSKMIDQADQKRQCLVNKETDLKGALTDTNRKIDELVIQVGAQAREANTEHAWELAQEAKKEKEDEANIHEEETSTESEECSCREVLDG